MKVRFVAFAFRTENCTLFTNNVGNKNGKIREMTRLLFKISTPITNYIVNKHLLYKNPLFSFIFLCVCISHDPEIDFVLPNTNLIISVIYKHLKFQNFFHPINF